jgi:hypothetical protein
MRSHRVVVAVFDTSLELTLVAQFQASNCYREDPLSGPIIVRVNCEPQPAAEAGQVELALAGFVTPAPAHVSRGWPKPRDFSPRDRSSPH